jgi:hypothetical protein
MRRGSKPEIVISENGTLLGVNLSADFCAEHEWGIKGVKNAFGIPEEINKYGMARRKITRFPTTIRWVKYTKDENYEGFIFATYFHENDADMRASGSSELTIWKPFVPAKRKGKKNTETPSEQTLAAAWSEDDFAVVSTEPKQIAQLKEIFDQFEKLNIIIMLGARELFGNSGFIIGVADRIPQEYVNQWYESDKDWHEIRIEVDASGIEYLLKQAGCQYFALSPRRQKDGTIHFWLNPMQQHKNNFGWFTYEDLKQWAKGEGPIPMKTPLRA